MISGRDGALVCAPSSLRTGRADFPHPALQSVVYLLRGRLPRLGTPRNRASKSSSVHFPAALRSSGQPSFQSADLSSLILTPACLRLLWRLCHHLSGYLRCAPVHSCGRLATLLPGRSPIFTGTTLSQPNATNHPQRVECPTMPGAIPLFAQRLAL